MLNPNDVITKEQYNELVLEHGYSHWRKCGWNWTEHILNNGYVFTTDKEELEYTFDGITDIKKLQGGFIYSSDKRSSKRYYDKRKI